MKGIILAGGSGTRLYPVTQGISKQLLPIYDKPMIFYPLATLIQAGITEILIITTIEDAENFQRLLGDGSHLGIQLHYAQQPKPEGLAQAFLIGEEFIGTDSVALALGDNIFAGSQFTSTLANVPEPVGGTVFAYEVRDPQRYGVISFTPDGKAESIEEKPEHPRSPYAVVGLYFYDNSVVELAKTVKVSARGELEITAINDAYLQKGQLHVEKLAPGDVWLDTGTFDSMSEAAAFVEVLQKRTGVVIGSPEVAAWKQGLIDAAQLQRLAQTYEKSGYGQLLLKALSHNTKGSA
ncbi:glucose-1-phosphate thymidylyltransferase RfbA [Corynebacterium sp. HS2168-gen11]|uniref:glucose-1-phosphate thymidylyltransferase RfbA n=1 Tax=Corynebacterium sp. HS2168-gen11 TaxID=2974027 RepID=UPI00216AF8F3|nr:glucose-1-phosphate thymidylyltransferase RfbA [Corynebacterium sp. HS2168-gen11]MCS4535603.1 glucose-1-phosphate thymidylyltransferase RfbA [Corynebacterium sp. HS2168-gen11]